MRFPTLDVSLWQFDAATGSVTEISRNSRRVILERGRSFHSYAFYRAATKKLDPDGVVHVSNQNLSFLPFRRKVVTVYDIFRLTHGSFVERLTARALYSGLHGAAGIAAASSYTRAALVSAMGFRIDDIVLTPLGISTFMREQKQEPSIIDRPYILHVSSETPRKRFDLVLWGFAGFLKRSGNQNLLLIKAGRAEKARDRNRHIRMAAALGILDRVRFLDAVSERELRNLYNHCRAFLFPSDLEGFGLPPLEAMAQGAPVIASAAASLPEVLGDASLFAEPNGEAWIDALTAVLGNAELANSLSERGRKRASTFSWGRTAETTMQLYQRGFS